MYIHTHYPIYNALTPNQNHLICIRAINTKIYHLNPTQISNRFQCVIGCIIWINVHYKQKESSAVRIIDFAQISFDMFCVEYY